MTATTVDPLTREDQAALMRAARRFRGRDGPRATHYSEFDAEEAVAFQIGTGVHPSVFAEPEEHRLRVEDAPDGFTYARWNRAKKRGIRAACSVKLGPTGSADLAWVRPFVARVHELRRSRKYWAWLVRDVWAETGRGGNCSPRTLRHTFLANLAEETGDPFAVAAAGNVSLDVAWQYVRGANARRMAHAPALVPRVGAPG